jgi:prepilin-type N-terminal cleavage/methylation domain-containing protein
MSAGRRSGRPRRRGFTLIEAVSTIVILGAIGTVASGLIFTATDGYAEASVRAQLHTELSVALDRIVREMRNVPLDDAASGIAPDIDELTADSITWSMNHTIERAGAEVRLTIAGGTARPLLTDVTAFSVEAYDADNALLIAPMIDDACDPIRRIAITATIQRRGVSETLRTKVFLRTMMAESGG